MGNSVFPNVPSGSGMTESAELTSPTVSDDQDIGTTARRDYKFFTMPTTHKLFLIVGIQWKNGGTVAGNIMVGIDRVEAIPPVIVPTPLLLTGTEVAQAGTNSIQVNRQIGRVVVRAGDIIGIWISTDNASGILRAENVSNKRSRKLQSYTNVTPSISNTAWTFTTQDMHLQILYRGYS